MKIINSVYSTPQTEMGNILQNFHSRAGKHALILNSEKERENYGRNSKAHLDNIFINKL